MQDCNCPFRYCSAQIAQTSLQQCKQTPMTQSCLPTPAPKQVKTPPTHTHTVFRDERSTAGYKNPGENHKELLLWVYGLQTWRHRDFLGHQGHNSMLWLSLGEGFRSHTKLTAEPHWHASDKHPRRNKPMNLNCTHKIKSIGSFFLPQSLKQGIQQMNFPWKKKLTTKKKPQTNSSATSEWLLEMLH